MQVSRLKNHRFSNMLETALIMASLLCLLLAIAWLFAGRDGVLLVCFAGIPSLIIGGSRAGRLVLRLYQAVPLTPEMSPDLHRLAAILSDRAGISEKPELYYIPSNAPLAFSVGLGRKGGIALSDGLLRMLSWREVTGVVAHELSHIAGRDTWVKGVADVASRMVSAVSFAGQMLLLLNLPFYLMGEATLPWLPIFAMMFSPMIMTLLQLALSRSREYEADRSAVELTGDPFGLASALEQMENYQRRQLRRLFVPYGSVEVPSVLRTHPGTEKRIEKLLEMADEAGQTGNQEEKQNAEDTKAIIGADPPEKRPRSRISGLWY